MRENAEQRAVEERLAKITSELRQIKVVLVVLFLVSPVGVYLFADFTHLIAALGVVGFWIAMAVAGGFVLLLCLSRLTKLHKTLELSQDELARILREHDRREGNTPA